MNIAIIGAGLAGSILANRLCDFHNVTIFEKARGPGGRMSTRRADPFAFDHGAQYFTAENPDFQDFLAEMEMDGLVGAWPDQVARHGDARVSEKLKYVAIPGMNAICKYLAIDMDLRTQIHIESLERTAEGWRLVDKKGEAHGPFDWVISTAPSVQTAALFPPDFSGHTALGSVQMQGCFALMLGFDQPLTLDWSALKSGEPLIGWMAVNSAKPGRPEPYALLIQSDNAWAEAHLEDDPEAVMAALLEAGSKLADLDLSVATHQKLHRWRYAATPKPAGQPFLFDAEMQLAACGDWCLGSKVEAAFSSASALADHILTAPKA
ncbi:MAG: NAD(P)/FAD-dependent oxidoreductase [Henriciella sp.]